MSSLDDSYTLRTTDVDYFFKKVNTIFKSQKQNAEQKKPETKEHTLNYSIYLKF